MRKEEIEKLSIDLQANIKKLSNSIQNAEFNTIPIPKYAHYELCYCCNDGGQNNKKEHVKMKYEFTEREIDLISRGLETLRANAGTACAYAPEQYVYDAIDKYRAEIDALTEKLFKSD